MARKSSKKKRGKSKYSSTKSRRKDQRENREKFTSSSYIDAGDDVEFFEPKEGTNHIRIVPYELKADNEYGEIGELFWQREFGVIRNLGPEELWVVPDVAASKKLRKVVNEQEREGILDSEEVKDFWPKRRMLYNVQDLNSDTPDKILLWEFSYHLFQKMLEGELDENEDYDAYSDLVDGYSLKVRMKETKLGTYTFLDTTRIDFVEAEDLDDEIVDECYDLDSIVNLTDTETLMELFHGTSSDDEQEDEKPQAKKKKKREPEPEEDSDEEDEDEPEEDEDEPEEDEDDEEESEVSKSELKKGYNIVVVDPDDLDEEEFKAVITDLTDEDDEVEVLYDGDDEGDEEVIDITWITSYTEPKRKKKKGKRSKKK